LGLKSDIAPDITLADFARIFWTQPVRHLPRVFFLSCFFFVLCTFRLERARKIQAGPLNSTGTSLFASAHPYMGIPRYLGQLISGTAVRGTGTGG